MTCHNVLQTLRITHEALGAALGTRAAHRGGGPQPARGRGRAVRRRGASSIIAPAIAAARAEGIDASGPFAPDTVFMRARARAGQPGEFDVVVAMYHDQGLIPVKYLGVEQGVNVTLGLPLVRTSPDHGTAFDIAGTGRADPSSLIEAIRDGARAAERRSGLSGAAQAVADLAQQHDVFGRRAGAAGAAALRAAGG